MSGLALVTGANGHLGNNLVRALLADGQRVRASVRDVDNREPFAGLNCEVVYADLMDTESLRRAMQGVDTLYQVAAVFKQWARDPQREIITPTVEGTRHVLEAAAEAGVRRVVYVSSTATLDREDGLITENDWRTNDYGNPYYRAKLDSEKLAWSIARARGLEMVSILPGTIVGPHSFRLSETMDYMDIIFKQDVPFDVNFCFNIVDVRDVAAGMLSAAARGRPGERYIMAGDEALSGADLIQIASEIDPRVRPVPRLPRSVVMGMATFAELGSRITGREPIMLRSQVQLFYGRPERYSNAKAERELGYAPRPSRQAAHDAFLYLRDRQAAFAGKSLA